MTEYGFTEDQMMLKELCTQIAEEKIKPVREHYDVANEFPWDIVKIFAESDLFAVSIDEEYGGMGGGVMEMVIMVEELSKACGGIAGPGREWTWDVSDPHLGKRRAEEEVPATPGLG